MAEQVFPVTVKAKPKPKQPTLLEALMAAGSSAYQGANQYAQEAAADPVNQIGFAGPIGNRLIREMGAGQVKQLIDDKLGYEPAKRAFGDASTLLDILSGKEKSVPFAPAYAGQKATDAALNAGQAGLDVATVLPFVPKMPKGASPSPMGKPYSFGGVANDFLPDSQLSMGFGSSGKDGQRSLAQIIGDAIKGKGPPGAVTNAVEDQAPPGAFFAYHGSPHDFDRFDLSKIGTGEGAQAYGRGLYFAESPKTGQAYRDAMLFDAIQGVKDPARREAALVLHRNNWDVAAAQKELGRNATPEQVKMLSDVAENPPGGLYKVKIDADANAFKEFEAPPTEAEIEAMKKAGIPGLKYFDNGSRASEQGTRNYVVFDDNLVNIIAKNGKPFAPRNPLDQFTPPTSIDDIFTGGAPRGPRELSGGPTNPAGLDGSAFNLNTPEVPYDPARGFGGLDAKFAADKNAKTLSEALAKRAKPPGYDDWSPEWRAAYDKGLDMSQEARMARAREQGFNVDERLYHGTGADFPAFDKAKFGSNYGFDKDSKMAAFFTTDPEVAGSYANTSADQLTRKRLKANPEYRRIEDEYIKGLSGGGYEGASARLKAMRQSEKSGDQIIPVFARGNYLESDMGGARYSADAYHDALSKASNQKLNGARFNYVADGADMTKPSDVVGIFDPANIRSTSAAFDPANAGKPTLLGMGAPFEGKGKPPGYNDWAPEWRAAYDKGLPMDQASRMQRAREQGFDTNHKLYHGTDDEFSSFDIGRAGSGANAGLKENAIFLTDNPAVADSYLSGGYVRSENARGRSADLGDGTARWYGEKSNVLPVMVKDGGNFDYWDWGGGGYSPGEMASVLADAKKSGSSGAVLRGVRDPGIIDTIGPVGNPRKPSNLVAVFDPANIRSVNAAFDPDNIGKANLLGMGRAAADSDLIKLLMAYGAFGGMSAGALATMDAQKHQKGGF